jgi:hypothetical protein
VDECNARPPATDAWRLVDETYTLLGEMSERCFDVGHGKRNVMQPLAAGRQEPPDGRVLVERLEKLEERATYREHRFLDPLLFDDFPMQRLDTVLAAKTGDGLVEVVYGNGHVVEVVREHTRIIAPKEPA